MRNDWIRVWIHKLSTYMETVLTLIAGANSVLLATPDNKIHIEWLLLLKEHGSLFLLLACGLAIPVCTVIKVRSGGTWVWHIIDQFLDEYNRYVFNSHGQSEIQDPLHFHRITLFKFYPQYSLQAVYRALRYRRRWDACLVPRARSGHLTQGTDVYFIVPDDGSVQGVAGAAWAGDGKGSRFVIPVPNLPDVSGPKVSKKNVREYSDRAWVSENWVAKRRPKARCIYAMPVDAGGKKWGVLVLDSRCPDELSSVTEGFQRLMGESFSTLLENV